MSKMNCWELMNCGRESNGRNVGKFGVCPAALTNEYDGIHEGKAGGRFCWTISGTLCHGKPSGAFAYKLLGCLDCKFLKFVQEEEGRFFFLTPNKARETKI